MHAHTQRHAGFAAPLSSVQIGSYRRSRCGLYHTDRHPGEAAQYTAGCRPAGMANAQ
jgi:hypothetical protein